MHPTPATEPSRAEPGPASPHPAGGEAQGVIDQLWIYPVKSCAGVALGQAGLTETGLALDRAWMVVDAQGRFLTQREQPRMVLIQPDIQGPDLVLRAPGMPPWRADPAAALAPREVRVWRDDLPAWDMGDPAAHWCSTFLGLDGLRLVRFDPAQRRLSSLDWTGGMAAPNQFSDGYPLLLTTLAAQDELNRHLQAAGQRAVSLLRMRANLIVAGLPAHDEDHWAHLRCEAADPGRPDVLLQPVKPCARCPIPDIDPETAESTPHVSQALQGYRQDSRLNGALTFGMNAIVRQGVGQTLFVGQRVRVDYGFEPLPEGRPDVQP